MKLVLATRHHAALVAICAAAPRSPNRQRAGTKCRTQHRAIRHTDERRQRGNDEPRPQDNGFVILGSVPCFP